MNIKYLINIIPFIQVIDYKSMIEEQANAECVDFKRVDTECRRKKK